MRTLPPISFPTPIGDDLVETATPYPPELPPGDFLTFQGFSVLPQRKLLVSKLIAICNIFVLMNGIIPLFLMQVTIPQSYPTILLALIVSQP